MAANKSMMIFSRRVYAVGVLGMGLATLAFREFDPGQPVPRHFAHRSSMVSIAGALMVVAAASVLWRRSAAWGALTLSLYYGLFVVGFLHGRLLISNYTVFGTYEEIAMQFALALGALTIYSTAADIDATLLGRLTRACQLAFGICVLIWGGAHFIYRNLTAPLVPKWLPPGQVFWGYLTGICFVAAGLAILTGIKARLAATLLTIMIACFGLFVNDRILLDDLSSHWNWSESGLNLALIGVAWAMANSLPPYDDPRAVAQIAPSPKPV